MELGVLQLIAIFIVSCIAGMEGMAEEFQMHRPLLACTLIGFILGDLTTGIIIGGTLEMIALGWMNIGAAVSPDSALAAVISTILVIAGHQSIGAGIAIAIPLAAAGQVLGILCRTLTVFFQHKADDYAEEGNLSGIDLCHFGAMGIQALRVAIPSILVAMYVGTGAMQAMLNAIPPVITGGLQVAGGFIVVVGYAMVINMMKAPYLMPIFFLGFVFAAFTNFNLVSFGVIGLAIATVYIQLNPKYNQNQALAAVAGTVSDDELD